MRNDSNRAPRKSRRVGKPAPTAAPEKNHRELMLEIYKGADLEPAKRAGILPVKPLPGCPQLPQVHFGDTWLNRTECLDAAEKAFRDGYGLAALVAFRWCAYWAPADPLPDWLRRAMANGIGAYLDGYVDSLEEGLGASRGNVKDRPETLAARDFAGQMYLDICREIEGGAKRDFKLWASIAKRYGLSRSTVERTVGGLGLPLPETPRPKRRQKRRAL